MNISHIWSELEFKHQLMFGVIALVGFISFWRGIYGLWIYAFPQSYLLNHLLSLLVGFELLLVTNHLIRWVK
jgi:hypothetical protein